MKFSEEYLIKYIEKAVSRRFTTKANIQCLHTMTQLAESADHFD